MADIQYGLPGTALMNVKKKLDQMRLGGRTVTPQMYTSLYEAELNTLADKAEKRRALNIEENKYNTYLSENKRQFDINTGLKEDELASQKIRSIGSMVGQVGLGAALYDVASKGKLSNAVGGLWDKVTGKKIIPDENTIINWADSFPNMYNDAPGSPPSGGPNAGLDSPAASELSLEPTSYFNPNGRVVTSPSYSILNPGGELNTGDLQSLSGESINNVPGSSQFSPGNLPAEEIPYSMGYDIPTGESPLTSGGPSFSNVEQGSFPVADTTLPITNATSYPVLGGVATPPAETISSMGAPAEGLFPANSSPVNLTQFNPYPAAGVGEGAAAAAPAAATGTAIAEAVPEMGWSEAATGAYEAVPDSMIDVGSGIGTGFFASAGLGLGANVGTRLAMEALNIGGSREKSYAGNIAGGMAAGGMSFGPVGAAIGGLIGAAISFFEDCVLFSYMYGRRSKQVRYARIYCFRFLDEDTLLGYYQTAKMTVVLLEKLHTKRLMNAPAASFFRFILWKLGKEKTIRTRDKLFGYGALKLFKAVRFTTGLFGLGQFVPSRTCLPLIRKRDELKGVIHG